MALTLTRSALIEDCARAALIIAPFPAPAGCGAATVIDRRRLDATGALTLKIAGERFDTRASRAVGENRPWSRPSRVFGRVRVKDGSEANADDVGAADRLD
ncbi:MAG: hypothetical protein NVS2B5_26710 [Beijerinckiaceae bacterium]